MQGRGALLLILWALVLLELLLPIPGPLSIGALYVLIARPAGFPALVARLYGSPPVA